MYVFLGGRMYKKKGVGCTKKGGRMYVDNFMFQQVFYRVVHLIPNFTQRGGAALTRNKKGPYGPIFLLP